jgi:hypothetical protein
MTVAEIEATMSVTEFFEWMAYFEYKDEQEKKAMRKAQAGSKLRRR